MLWEPLADTMTAPLKHRSKDAWATFRWYQLAQQKGLKRTGIEPKGGAIGEFTDFL